MSIPRSRLLTSLFVGSLVLGLTGCADPDHDDPSQAVEGTTSQAQALSTSCADASSKSFSLLIERLDGALELADKNRENTRARNLEQKIALKTHPDGTGGTYGYANELYHYIKSARDELAQFQNDTFTTPNHRLLPTQGYSLTWGFARVFDNLSYAVISASVNLYQNDTQNRTTDARDAGDQVLAAVNELNALRANTYRCWGDAYIP